MPEDLVYRQAYTFLIFPVQGSFSNDIHKACEKKTNKHQHRNKPIPSQRTKIHCIRVEENDFNIKQHKKNGYQKIFHRHGLTRIAKLLNTTFKYLKLVACLSFRPQQTTSKEHNSNQPNGKNQLNCDREIITRSADLLDLRKGV